MRTLAVPLGEATWRMLRPSGHPRCTSSARDRIRHIHILLQPELADIFGQPVNLAGDRDLPL